MKILHVNSDKINKNDMVWGLLQAGFEVDIPEKVITMDKLVEEELEYLLKSVERYDLVTSQNFIPTVAVACNQKQVKYASWIYDSPQYHLFAKEARFDTNYIFTFDKKQSLMLKETGIKNVFYFPLAGNIAKASAVCINEDDVKNYSCDVSFIGGLYEKNAYRSFADTIPERNRNVLEKALSDNFFSWGTGHSIYDKLDGETESILLSAMNEADFCNYRVDPLYAAKTLTLVYELAARERKLLLTESAKRFDTFFYTKNPELYDFCDELTVKGPVYEENLYKAYYLSKINLNVTMRSIETGIPQRVFDIMAVGGCVFTNYQEEVGELFNIDRDIVVYRNLDEYLEKADYYLRHDEARERIGINGYIRVKDEYNFEKASLKMIRIISEN